MVGSVVLVVFVIVAAVAIAALVGFPLIRRSRGIHPPARVRGGIRYEISPVRPTLAVPTQDDFGALEARLLVELAGVALGPALVSAADEAIRGLRAVAQLRATFRELGSDQAVLGVALALLRHSQQRSIGDHERARDCAAYLRVMRAVVPHRLHPALDRFQHHLDGGILLATA